MINVNIWRLYVEFFKQLLPEFLSLFVILNKLYSQHQTYRCGHVCCIWGPQYQSPVWTREDLRPDSTVQMPSNSVVLNLFMPRTPKLIYICPRTPLPHLPGAPRREDLCKRKKIVVCRCFCPCKFMAEIVCFKSAVYFNKIYTNYRDYFYLDTLS